ncbi:MAG: hypothetical protein WAU88_03900 [Candidatus Zixiibacteriota bacterium]
MNEVKKDVLSLPWWLQLAGLVIIVLNFTYGHDTVRLGFNFTWERELQNISYALDHPEFLAMVFAPLLLYALVALLMSAVLFGLYKQRRIAIRLWFASGIGLAMIFAQTLPYDEWKRLHFADFPLIVTLMLGAMMIRSLYFWKIGRNRLEIDYWLVGYLFDKSKSWEYKVKVFAGTLAGLCSLAYAVALLTALIRG